MNDNNWKTCERCGKATGYMYASRHCSQCTFARDDEDKVLDHALLILRGRHRMNDQTAAQSRLELHMADQFNQRAKNYDTKEASA